MNCTAHFSRSPINVGKDDWTFTAHLPGLSSPHIIFLFNCDVDTASQFAFVARKQIGKD